MHALRSHTATVLLLIATCAGCTDKDRDLAKRTGDGADTFEFKPPPDHPPSGKPLPVGAIPERPPKRGAASAKDGDGSETFEFKQDPRTLPKTAKSGEK